MRDAVVLESGQGALEIPISVQLPTVTLMAKSDAVLVEQEYTWSGEYWPEEFDLEACLSECGWFDFACNAECLLVVDGFAYEFTDSVVEKIEGFASDDVDDTLKFYISPATKFDVDALEFDTEVEIVTKLKDADIAIKALGEGHQDCGDGPVVINPPGADRIDFMVPNGHDALGAVELLVDSAVEIYAS